MLQLLLQCGYRTVSSRLVERFSRKDPGSLATGVFLFLVPTPSSLPTGLVCAGRFPLKTDRNIKAGRVESSPASVSRAKLPLGAKRNRRVSTRNRCLSVAVTPYPVSRQRGSSRSAVPPYVRVQKSLPEMAPKTPKRSEAWMPGIAD